MKNKLTLGLWALGSSSGFHSPMDARKAKNIIKTAYKCGIHSFDSAFSYNTDSLLYSALKEINVKTEDAEIFEKVMPYKTIRKKAEASLRALKRDFFDALIIHWPRSDEDLFYALKEAERLREEKKALELGLSNFPSPLFLKIASDFPITYNEYYSSPTMLNEKIEGYKSLKYGIFSFGSFFKDGIPEDERKNLYYYKGDAYNEFKKEKESLTKIADEKGVRMKTLLFSFALYDGPERVIIGATDEKQLSDFESIPLNESEYNKIYLESIKLNEYNKADNIFAHNWRNS